MDLTSRPTPPGKRDRGRRREVGEPNEEALVKLGSEKLARLVIGEAKRNAAFRKLVAAALAASKGPAAVDGAVWLTPGPIRRRGPPPAEAPSARTPSTSNAI